MDLEEQRDRLRSRTVLRRMERETRRAARRRRPAHWVLATLTTVATLAGAATGAHVAGVDVPGLSTLLSPRAYVQVEGRALAVPRPEPASGRQLPPVPVTTTGRHAFLHTTDDGGPVGYDPCRPVRYVIRPDQEPAGGRHLVEEAARTLSEATGLRLVMDGETDEPPLMDRPLIQPDRYGPGWAPVLIAWSDERETPELAGRVAGVGGSAAVPGADGTGRWLAAGRVVLDAPEVEQMLASPGTRAQALSIVLHELAHVVGLDHVDDADELMHPLTSHRTGLGPGDRQGLALLGQVPCEGD